MRKVHLQQFKKGRAKFLTKYVKWVPFVNERYTKGVPFLLKTIYKRASGLDLGGRGARGRGLQPGKKALLSIYLPDFTMGAEVSFWYCQSLSLFFHTPEQTT